MCVQHQFQMVRTSQTMCSASDGGVSACSFFFLQKFILESWYYDEVMTIMIMMTITMIQPGCVDTIRMLRYKPAYRPLGDVVRPNIGRHRSGCLAESGRNHEDVIKHCGGDDDYDGCCNNGGELMSK